MEDLKDKMKRSLNLHPSDDYTLEQLFEIAGNHYSKIILPCFTYRYFPEMARLLDEQYSTKG
jgi:hypothetical protein